MCYYDHAVAMMLELDRWKRDCGPLPNHHHQAGFGQTHPHARKSSKRFALGLRSGFASVVAASAVMWMAIA